MYVENDFRKFVKKKGFCVKLVGGSLGTGIGSDPWLELHYGGINIGFTRLFSKTAASLRFYDAGIECEVRDFIEVEKVKGLCAEFTKENKETNVAVIFSPDLKHWKVDIYKAKDDNWLESEQKHRFENLPHSPDYVDWELEIHKLNIGQEEQNT